jgi:hypothetical protein
MAKKKLMNVEKVMKDMKKLLTETHDVKQVKDFYNYKGVDITHNSILATNFTIKEDMTKNNLDWGREEHGIEMLDKILLKIFQLGFQQGMIYSENIADEKEAWEKKLKGFQTK